MDSTGDSGQGHGLRFQNAGIRNDRLLFGSQLPRKLTQISGSVLYWTFQTFLLLATISFNVLSNPIVWFLIKTLLNTVSEILIYIVLGICSILISIITNIDDYYTKGRHGKRVTIHNDLNQCSQAAPSIKKFVGAAIDKYP
ncbi:hypothetical protein GWI33_022063 [Rhynchophorus ferrugineus]|uniref:Uncharacterized protein n=1 Tax=Rhynchophorus ferrugineus TaxID=354439 RepID=A0A834INQ2_RHYFE|nr:hypothetical protein GWI33_022063 [Rhynchophorus ferrugineus]